MDHWQIGRTSPPCSAKSRHGTKNVTRSRKNGLPAQLQLIKSKSSHTSFGTSLRQGSLENWPPADLQDTSLYSSESRRGARNVTRKRKKKPELACTAAAAPIARAARQPLARDRGWGASEIDRPLICRARPPTRTNQPSHRFPALASSILLWRHSKLALLQKKALLHILGYLYLYLSSSCLPSSRSRGKIPTCLL